MAMIKEILKIDLDMEEYDNVIIHLHKRLTFLHKIGILPTSLIEKVFVLKKSKYSAKIYLNKSFKDKTDLIVIQSVLGSDWKHTAITYRDYKIGLRNYNRLFNIKRYPNGDYKSAEVKEVTKYFK